MQILTDLNSKEIVTPFLGEPTDSAAEIWRNEHKDLLSIMAGPSGADGAGSHEMSVQFQTIVTRTAQSFYAGGADLKDRMDVIRWTAQQCVAWNTAHDGDGLSTAHIFCGRLMQTWAMRSWVSQKFPDWARGLQAAAGYQNERVKAVLPADFETAKDDLRAFLEAYHQVSKGQPPVRKNKTSRTYNTNSVVASTAWRVLASISPGRVPASLVNDLVLFEKSYMPVESLKVIQQLTEALWDRQILTASTQKITAIPEEKAIQQRKGGKKRTI